MSKWNFKSDDEMFSHLIGKDFGENPKQRLAEINKIKILDAEKILLAIDPKKNDTLVEIGSGTGVMAAHMSEKVFKIICCDVSESFLQVAKENCNGKENVSFHLIGAPPNLNFIPDNSVDSIFSFNVFIHLNLYDIFSYFKEFARILKPNGVVWFDYSSADVFKDEIPSSFIDMHKLYLENSSQLMLLLNFNSINGIVGIAKHFGFSLEKKSEAFQSGALMFKK